MAFRPRVRKWVRAARRLSDPGELLLLLRAFAFAASVPVLLRLPLPWLQALVRAKRVPPPPTPDVVARIVRVVDAVVLTPAPFVRRGCLTRGLTLYYFLSRAGVPVRLCFGVRGADGSFSGHCWVEKDGEPFLEAADPRQIYAETYSFFAARTPQSPARPMTGR